MLLSLILFKILKIYFLISILSIICNKILKNKNTNISVLEQKILNNELYNVFDFIKDSLINKRVFTSKNNTFLFLFFFLFVINTLIRLIQSMIIIFFIIRYSVKILILKHTENYLEIRLYKEDYVIKYHANFFFLLKLLFFKIPKWIGFTTTYFIHKKTQKKIKFSYLVNNFLFFLVIGCPPKTLYLTLELSEKIYSRIEKNNYKYVWYYLPDIFDSVYGITFSNYKAISEMLKIYKDGDELIFNPGKKQKEELIVSIFNATRATSYNSVGIKSIDEGRLFYHYGGAMQSYFQLINYINQVDISTQVTGRIPTKYENLTGHIQITTNNYKNTSSYHIYNIMRARENLIPCDKPITKLWHTWNIDNFEKIKLYWSEVNYQRIYRQNLPLIYETKNNYKIINISNSFAEEILITYKNDLSLETVKMYEKWMNRFLRIDTKDLELLKLYDVNSKNAIIDFNNYTNELKYKEARELILNKFFYDFELDWWLINK